MKGLARAAAVGAGMGACTWITFHIGVWLTARTYRGIDYLKRKRHN